jgi:hypothetical protein
MLLGDLIRRLTDDAAATEIIVGLGDLTLLQAMTERAQGEGIDLATFSQDAVRSYGAHASEEEWVTLLGQIGKSPDPAAVYLKRAFASAIQPSCEIHGR